MRTTKFAALCAIAAATSACPGPETADRTFPAPVTSDAGADVAQEVETDFRTVDRDLIDTRCEVAGGIPLNATARNAHLAAKNARQAWVEAGSSDPDAKQRWVTQYLCAAELYKAFIADNPATDAIDELTYYTGEAFYFAERYELAIDHYAWVRGRQQPANTWLEPAARAVIQSYEMAIERDVASGALPELTVPHVDQISAAITGEAPARSTDLPPLYAGLRDSLDAYLGLVTDPTLAPGLAMNAAMISLGFFELDDAVARLDKVIASYCAAKPPQVAWARDALASIYLARETEDDLRALNERFITDDCGDAEAIELSRAQNRAIGFRLATRMFAKAATTDDFVAASTAFYEVYRTAPADDPNRVLALYNAAIAATRAGKDDVALAYYEEFFSNEHILFRSAPQYADVIGFVAKAYAAKGKVDLAIELYRRLDEESKDAATQANALWQITQLYKKKGNLRKLSAAYEAWRKRFGDTDNADRYVFSFYDLAKAYEGKGKKKDAKKLKKKTHEAWEKMGSPPRTNAARYAGEFALEAAQLAFNDKSWRRLELKRTKSAKGAKKELERLDKAYLKIDAALRALRDYEVPVYTVAAHAMQGQIAIMYSEKIAAMPVPTDIETLAKKHPDSGIIEQFDVTMQRRVTKERDVAKTHWEMVVSLSNDSQLTNEWTELARDKLHEHFPDVYATKP
jgi:hypothetical protein